MNKSLIILGIIFSIGVIVLATFGVISLLKVPPVIVQQTNNDFSKCAANGYVPNSEVNQLINISNRLIIAVNQCAQDTNVTIPFIQYLPEK